MAVKSAFFVLLYLTVLVQSGYRSTGNEVVPGSVLLPPTARGRYLANIVRRQGVDGTGVKFNREADSMNAESKRKVDVLSDEMLPYIIAEQERRLTLQSRIMSVIQTGERGITVVEMRNKSPLIVYQGRQYRCPPNRPILEPDGTGIIMCAENQPPTPIIYDSCANAVDRTLYYTKVGQDKRYFFCNRQVAEGPNLPHTTNGTVVACDPSIRTALNYTKFRCALDDTDDVILHYRYFPDSTYSYVADLDPDKEMCDQWNPCQIGYIFSLPSHEQARKANEYFPGYDGMKTKTLSIFLSEIKALFPYSHTGQNLIVPFDLIFRVRLFTNGWVWSGLDGVISLRVHANQRLATDWSVEVGVWNDGAVDF